MTFTSEQQKSVFFCHFYIIKPKDIEKPFGAFTDQPNWVKQETRPEWSSEENFMLV